MTSEDFGADRFDRHPEKRCQGESRRKRREGLIWPETRCEKWGTKASGYRYCRTHGGSKNRKRTYKKGMHGNVYSRFVGPTLRDKLKELRESSPAERNSLKDEVDLQRAYTMEALRISSMALAMDEVSDAAKFRAIGIAQSALDTVAKLVEKAAKVNALSDKSLDLEYIDFVTVQFSRIIERHLSPLPEGGKLIEAIVEEIKTIKLPDRQHADISGAEKAEEIRKTLALMEESA